MTKQIQRRPITKECSNAGTEPNLAAIKMLVLDVDGVLTDGTLIISANGSEGKLFNSLDDHGIRLWRRAGLKVAILSGRFSEPVAYRAQQLEADYVLQDCHDKLSVLQKLLAESGLSTREVACVGDDLPDLPLIRCAGFGAAVANAVDEVKQHADYVTARPGGAGAVREVIEYILKSTGRWHDLMKRYLL
jgi:3-deoxy-D-manno-octulosonate 8-phosphate phosphatase (KDO 8-P phosphatase)